MAEKMTTHDACGFPKPQEAGWKPTPFTYVVWPLIAAALGASIYFSLGELGAFFIGAVAGIALCLEFGGD